MTELLRLALAATDKLPPQMQDELARMILAFAGEDQEVYELSQEELASLEAALAEADRAEYATDEEVAALWTKHGR
jgi:predicted transcriptional regulator